MDKGKRTGFCPSARMTGSTAIGIENDCEDQAITIMPEVCVHPLCAKAGKPLKNRNGFMVCPTCGDFYGRPPRKRRLPEIGEYVRGQGTLVTVQNIYPPPPPENKDYIFEEITVSVELRLGSEVLNKICTLWDAYGKETSVTIAIREAQRYASEREIGPEGQLEVLAIKRVEQVRKRPHHEDNFYDKTFSSFKSLEVGSKDNLPDPVESIVWSSREEKHESSKTITQQKSSHRPE